MTDADYSASPSISPARSWRVAVDDDATSALYEPATHGSTNTVFVFAHGAGGHMADRSMQQQSELLRARGLDTVRFNFLYKERGSGRPDPMPLLQRCIEAVVSQVRDSLHPARLIIGGRSMGGRAASMLAAEGFAADALLLLAYPLHPDGQPAKRRDAHLPDIRMPTLCINGTRDALCRQDLMEEALTRVQPTFTMHWVSDADHMFHVLKRSGRTEADVLREIGDAVAQWLPTI